MNRNISLLVQNAIRARKLSCSVWGKCHQETVLLKYRPDGVTSLLLHNTSSVRMQCGPGGCCGFSKEELKKRLTPEQYLITQERDTERPFTGKYYRHEEKGTYSCVVCGQAIFSSETKYPSPCGWPAFFDVIESSKVKLTQDLSHVSCNLLLLTLKTDMTRTEVSCSKCGSHLGHLFDDGPKPTGKRYCINSAALDFQKASDTNDSAAA